MQRSWRADDGSVTVQAVFAVPLLITVLLFVVLCGQLVQTRLRVDSAAQDAARAASLARTAPEAQKAARQAAAEQLGRSGAGCASYTVGVDTSNFRPGGAVRASVRCAASMQGLTGLGVPGTIGVNGHAVSPIDYYRGTT